MSPPQNSYAQLVGKFYCLWFIDDYRFARFDDEAFASIFGQTPDGIRPDARHVKPHILIGFGGLDERPAP